MATATATTIAANVQEAINSYYFLRNINEEDNIIYVKSITAFEKINISDTYDFYGQPIGHDAAGDIHISNSYSFIGEAWEKMKLAFEDYEEAFENEEEYEVEEQYKESWANYLKLVNNNTDSSNVNVADFTHDYIAEKFEDETYCFTCTAYNYWNGSNFESIVLDSEQPDFVSEWEILTGEEEVKYATIFANAQYAGEGFGTITSIYTDEDGTEYSVSENFYQGAWEFKTIVEN